MASALHVLQATYTHHALHAFQATHLAGRRARGLDLGGAVEERREAVEREVVRLLLGVDDGVGVPYLDPDLQHIRVAQDLPQQDTDCSSKMYRATHHALPRLVEGIS
jgi:hypothetical protein